jgi:hypothetical protein
VRAYEAMTTGSDEMADDMGIPRRVRNGDASGQSTGSYQAARGCDCMDAESNAASSVASLDS